MIVSFILRGGARGPENDQPARDRVDTLTARRFLQAMAAGTYRRATLSPSQFDAARAIDERHADLDLGIVDASVMAIAEATDSVVLTFDFTHFRAAPPARGRAW